MSIKAYDAAPYNDDYNTSSLEGKNYLRILFKPGFSVQVRELNQLQSMLQSQIDKFGRSIYKEGPVLDGSTYFSDNTDFIDVEMAGTTLNSDMNLILGNTVRLVGAASTAISAEIFDYTLLSTSGNQTWRFYIRYSSSGATTGAATNTGTFSNANSLQIDTSIEKGGSVLLSAGGTLGTVNNTGYAGTITTDVGVFFARGSFIYNDSVKYLHIEKPSSTFNITGKAVFQLVETTVGATTDSTLYDNAQGTPNYVAPGADRYTITLTPKFLTSQSELTGISQNTSIIGATGSSTVNYLDLLDVNVGNYVAPARTEYSQLDNTLAIRTAEESGNYVTNPFKISQKEHLNDGAGNGGRYLSSDTPAGDESKFVTTLEPSVAYVQGYRVPLEESIEIISDKARTTLASSETVFGSAKIGNYIEGTIVNVPEFTAPDETFTFNGTGSVTCKIRSIEFKSGSTYKVYIYDLSGDIPLNATTLSGNKATGSSGFVLTLTGTTTSTPTPIFDTANNANLIKLPYSTIESISKGGSSPNFDSEVIVRSTKTGISCGASATSFNVTVSDLTGKSAGRFYSDSTSDYIIIDQSNGAVITTTGVSLGGTNNNTVTVSGGSALNSKTVTLVASAKVKLGSSGLTAKSKTETTVTLEVVTGSAVATNDILALDQRDIISITAATDTNGVNILSDVELFDNGQRDVEYKVGRVKYTGSGVTGLKVTYKYFAHGAGDFFDVSSYSSIAYKDIPQYKGVFLSDVLDFRNADNATSGITLDPNAPTKVTLNYYLPRIDKISVNTLGDFSIIKGEAGLDPELPTVPDDSMGLYDVFVPAFTRNIDDIQVRIIDNKRYTMSDIGKLEKRIKNLEYYTSLSLLEKEASTKQIFGDDGERFKNGILVDTFQTQGIADVLDSKLACSFDTEQGILNPQYTLKNKRLRFNGYNGSDGSITRSNPGGTLLTLPYTHTTLIDQPTANVDISVNPYDLATWNGTVELSPASDEWIETERRPRAVFNINGGLDSLVSTLNESNALTTLTDWEVHTVGKKIAQKVKKLVGTGKSGSVAAQKQEIMGFVDNRPVREITQSFETVEVRTGVKQEASLNNVEQKINDTILDVSFIPFIRSRRVYFKAQLLKPNTRVYAFFDDINVSQFCTKTAFVRHADNSTVDTSTFGEADPLNALGISRVELVSDADGDLEGFFVIPNNDTYQFSTGTRKFKLTDSSTNDLANTTTSAEVFYAASGLLQSKQEQIVSTQQIQITEGERIKELRQGVLQKTKTQYYDPLAQSFIIGNIPTGTYTTKIDLWFRAKSSNVPLSVHLVTVENGIPTQKIVPFSKVIKKPAEVNISEDATSATTFQFESPVYLSPGVEYAIVVMSNSPDYRLWLSEVGKDDVTTGSRVSKNTYAGVSFKSQNASTWTPDQNRDFKMKIYRAQFTGGTGNGTTYRVDPMFANGESAFEFSSLRLVSEEMNFAQTETSYNLRTSSEVLPLNPASKNYFNTVRSFASADTDGNITGTEAAVNITLKSTSDFVSPVVDLDRLSLIAVKNTITNAATVQPSNAASDTELLAAHGNGTARYITREVELNNAADQLNIFLLANKPSENTEVRVYARVKSTDARLRDEAFVKIEPQEPLSVSTSGGYSEAEYLLSNSTPFTSFQVKIVFTSENSALTPSVKDFRAIATI